MTLPLSIVTKKAKEGLESELPGQKGFRSQGSLKKVNSEINKPKYTFSASARTINRLESKSASATRIDHPLDNDFAAEFGQRALARVRQHNSRLGASADILLIFSILIFKKTRNSQQIYYFCFQGKTLQESLLDVRFESVSSVVVAALSTEAQVQRGKQCTLAA